MELRKAVEDSIREHKEEKKNLKKIYRIWYYQILRKNTIKLTARDISTRSAISLAFSAAIPSSSALEGVNKRKRKRRRVGKGGIENW